MNISNPARYGLRAIALVYLFVLLVVPVGLIFWRAFEPGFGQFWDWITTPAAISALQLSLIIVAIVVPLNVVFGVITALALARGRFRGRGLMQAVVDLPFAVSPVVAGVALIALWGSHGWFGGVESLGFRVIFGLPGMVLATIFVTLPFVVREVEPVLHEIGTEQEEAAATLGASGWQTFWRITLPAIRWGLTYGIVLTVARSLGEYGAVTMVSSNMPGVSQTLTLLVHSRYTDDYNEYGAYAAATLLMLVAIAVLVAMTVIERRAQGRVADAATIVAPQALMPEGERLDGPRPEESEASNPPDRGMRRDRSAHERTAAEEK
ncbi:sulfate ABC transporter permease subunit CysW [Gordonia iterans]|uniref:Sulfate ABC transporter permease subunit CysW n=1 Tax=Gordonia iterans TaxID=1004901 RepID=A0A2S0KHM4_9ACTN|nr:sulfate ABC transporter permease subunit CysW [Gordonia iterans]AVM01180.1 sulfate ABC transporter permease subunit CysW [Gordonia iterans]